MHYFPLIPRLKAHYRHPKLAALMRWHANHRSSEGYMRGPCDSNAWKWTEERFPILRGKDGHRHVRLGLFLDGVNPFSMKNTQHSMWPICVVNYNIPPYLAIRKGHIILCALVPGENTFFFSFFFFGWYRVHWHITKINCACTNYKKNIKSHKLQYSGPSQVANMDVYLQPLIDELRLLWIEGVDVFDAAAKEDEQKYFNMRAILLWTMHDGPGTYI